MELWLAAYLITCAIEIPCYVNLVKRSGWPVTNYWQVAGLAWLVQFTQPLLWLYEPPDYLGLIVAELLVVLVEGGIFAAAGRHWLLKAWRSRRDFSQAKPALTGWLIIQALLMALIANICSVVIGMIPLFVIY